MILSLYGPDTYRSRKKLREIIEHYQKVHKSGLNLKCLDGEDLEFEEFKNHTQQASMFDEKKLIVLSNTFSNKDFQENFIKNAKDFCNSEDIYLFYDENKISAKDRFLKFLQKEGKCQEFSHLDAQDLKKWLKKEMAEYKVEISPKALDRLINFVGGDLWQLSNEIKKLVNFKKGKKIEPEDIETLVKPRIETDIFGTIDSIARKNKKRALELIHLHLEKGDNPLYLFSMINFQFRNLLIIKDLIEKHSPYPVILKKSGLHPFVVKKTYQLADKFTLEDLKKIYQKIFQVDLSIKTGKLKPEVALDLLIAEI